MFRMIGNYILQLLLAIDQFANVLLGGYADETLSSRAWRAYSKGRIFGKIFKPLIDTLFFWDSNHCRNAWESEIKRRQFPLEFRNRE